MKFTRSSGILLHPTSLPGRFGIGSLGHEAFEFVNFLHRSAQSLWQILPLGPTGYGDSPYSAFSAFAGNPLLICLERLVERGDLEPSDIEGIDMPEDRVQFGQVQGLKGRLLKKAAERFFSMARGERRDAFESFCASESFWLEDYVLFRALREKFKQQPWTSWPAPYRLRETEAMEQVRQELDHSCAEGRYAQFVFFEQWSALKDYAGSRGVRILGDIPIYVADDSADVWARPELFHLNEQGLPYVVAGVPPDYFSATGQRWGNPMYRWEKMAEDGFSWWIERLRHNLKLTDLVRIDHFRGLEAAWEIPAADPTAEGGRWVPVPGRAMLRKAMEALGEIPLVAEDLGIITPEVEALRDEFNLPGMNILHFAFGSGAANPYLPHNVRCNSLIYTGTHDNDTSLGWWNALGAEERQSVQAYFGLENPRMPQDLIRLAMSSVAGICITPLQDILELDGAHRMNTPGQGCDNWGWRFKRQDLTGQREASLRDLTRIYGRVSN